jgi:hypothetical protein
MAESSAFVRMAVMAVCLGATALGLANTYSENTDVVRDAERTACASDGCSFTKLREERSPFSQKFTFQVELSEKGKKRGASTDVECQRAYYLLGDYSCKVTSGGLGSGSAAP